MVSACELPDRGRVPFRGCPQPGAAAALKTLSITQHSAPIGPAYRAAREE